MTNLILLIGFIASIFLNLFTYTNGSIHKNLKYFETIHADKHVEHKIVKRGLKESNHKFNKINEVNFQTLGKDFRLFLTPQKDVLHPKFKAYTVDGDGKETTVHVVHENFFDGRVFGETTSHVNLHIEDGVMTGSIHTPDDTYYIEPSWRHLPNSDNRTMITYRASDIKLSWDPENYGPNEFAPKTCGYVKEDQELETDDDKVEFNASVSEKHREKRQIGQYDYTATKTRCSLLLVADYRFFQKMGGSSTKTTINYLISLIDRVHKIYNDTIWQDRQEIDGFKGMGFVIKKIVVHNEPTKVRQGEAHYNMDRKEWDVRSLLEVFSRERRNKNYCLAHLFTYQTFRTQSVLGLAYIASPRQYSHGGICTPEYHKNGYTLYLNSGLSSSRNHYGQRVITREADLVTAHEFGHNWGSEHDPDIPECSPRASKGGSYLMYTYSVSGYDVNNKHFSPCSLRSIHKVLQAKSSRCFSEPEESLCGNLKVEGKEECDAGLLGTEDNDTCCDNDCRLRPNAICSDKNSPCCQNCRYMQAGFKCRDAQYVTCEQESRCTGIQAECPKSPPMPDGTDCQEKGKCRNGICVPFCETRGLQSCTCDIENACRRCCRTKMNSTCFPMQPLDVLPDGTPCIQGFCNKGNCEKTIQDVVERFWDIIEDIDINQVLLFLRDNIVGTVVLVSILLWIPASCVVGFVDRKRRRDAIKRDEWLDETDLIYPSDRRRVITIRVPRAAHARSARQSSGIPE